MLDGLVDKTRADGRVAYVANESNGIDAKSTQLSLCFCRSSAGAVQGNVCARLG